MLGKPGKLGGKDGTVIFAICGSTFTKQHHACGNNHKGHYQGQGYTHGHHPAKINNRANIAHHQGGEGYDSCQHCI